MPEQEQGFDATQVAPLAGGSSSEAVAARVTAAAPAIAEEQEIEVALVTSAEQHWKRKPAAVAAKTREDHAAGELVWSAHAA